MSSEQELQKLRDDIDAVDLQLQKLINQRAKLALQVGKIKRTTDKSPVFYRPEREAQVLQQIVARNKGPLKDAQIRDIFRNVLTTCLALQQPIKVACLGPEGTYSQAAVFKHFGNETSTLVVQCIERVFREIEGENADYGVVPIENSTAGIINATLDALIGSQLTICGEIILPIHLYLLSSQENGGEIKKIYGHEQAFLQCDHWLNEHYPDINTVTVSSNAAAAKMALDKPDTAAIAGDLAREFYSLKIIASHIEDNPHNATRFIILGRQKVEPCGNDKTSLLISTPHTPGSLIDLMKPFAENGVNILQIASRPYRDRRWSYLFFIDIDGHQDDLPIKKALEMLNKKSVMLHVLGSYPKSV